jgi:hypothetical protein
LFRSIRDVTTAAFYRKLRWRRPAHEDCHASNLECSSGSLGAVDGNRRRTTQGGYDRGISEWFGSGRDTCDRHHRQPDDRNDWHRESGRHRHREGGHGHRETGHDGDDSNFDGDDSSRHSGGNSDGHDADGHDADGHGSRHGADRRADTADGSVHGEA